MKKMLLSVLLFAASVIIAQAQGFRVHRSDGAVYEFSVVADSIVFFDGEGDPNYQEPVPDYVLDAINQLQAYCANLNATCAENQVLSQRNAEMINELAQHLDNFKTVLQEVRVGCEAQFDQTKLYVDKEIAAGFSEVYQNLADIQTQSDNNSDRISNLEEDLSVVKVQNEKTYAKVAVLEADVHSFENHLMLLVERDAQRDAIINALYERIEALEAKVNQ